MSDKEDSTCFKFSDIQKHSILGTGAFEASIALFLLFYYSSTLSEWCLPLIDFLHFL